MNATLDVQTRITSRGELRAAIEVNCSSSRGIL